MEDTKIRLAIYPGTFDPITNDHISIIHRAKHLFDKIIIAVAQDSGKKPLFSIEERVSMINTTFFSDHMVDVENFSGLLVDYVEKKNAKTILRGLRAVSDFEYEFQTSLMNRKLCPEIETIFLISDYKWLYISSTVVKTVASLGGDVTDFVPENVLICLKTKYCQSKSNLVIT